VELYLGGAGKRSLVSSSPTWGAHGRVGLVIGPGQRRTDEGGGWVGIDVETQRPGGGGLVRAAAERECGLVAGCC
jgi:hypothetical protein